MHKLCNFMPFKRLRFKLLNAYGSGICEGIVNDSDQKIFHADVDKKMVEATQQMNNMTTKEYEWDFEN